MLCYVGPGLAYRLKQQLAERILPLFCSLLSFLLFPPSRPHTPLGRATACERHTTWIIEEPVELETGQEGRDEIRRDAAACIIVIAGHVLLVAAP